MKELNRISHISSVIGNRGIVETIESDYTVCGFRDCNRKFYPSYDQRKYCSKKCQQAEGNAKRPYRTKERVVNEVACEKCGIIFTTESKTKKFCSRKCNLSAYAKRKRARGKSE